MTEEEAEAILGKSVWDAQGKVPAKWPTPTARDGKGAAHYKDPKRNEADLTNKARSADGVQRGSLNPMWVEWLMGFPLGWTDLED